MSKDDCKMCRMSRRKTCQKHVSIMWKQQGAGMTYRHDFCFPRPQKRNASTKNIRNPANPFRMVFYPIIYKVLHILSVVGNGISEPSTVAWSDSAGAVKKTRGGAPATTGGTYGCLRCGGFDVVIFFFGVAGFGSTFSFPATRSKNRSHWIGSTLLIGIGLILWIKENEFMEFTLYG